MIIKTLFFKNNDILLITKKSHLHLIDLTIIKNAILKINTKGLDVIKTTVEFDFFIGKTNVVKTNNNDKIVWAKRKKRKAFSRFVLNKEPELTNKITIIAKKVNLKDLSYYVENNINSFVYELITAYFGELSPPEFRPTRNSKKTIEFWSNYAFVFGTEEIEGEVVEKNPYSFIELIKNVR